MKLKNTTFALFVLVSVASACGSEPPIKSPTSGAPATGTPSTTSSPEIAQIIDALCAAVERCDSTLTKTGCIAAMAGDDGKQIWDDLGLTGQENQLTKADVEKGITDGSIQVNKTVLNDCLHDFIELCDNGEGWPGIVGSYANAENLIWEEGSCPSILSESSGSS